MEDFLHISSDLHNETFLSYDRTYKNECQRWRNIIHRAEKSEDTSPEQLSKMKAAFEDFTVLYDI